MPPAKQELEVFIHDMLDMSAFCYDFHAIRTIVRANNGRTIKSGWFYSTSREVNFNRPELILTSTGTQAKDQNQQLKYDITPAAVLEFIKINRTLFEDDDKDGSLEFDESGTEKTTPFMLEAVLEDQGKDNLKIVDYDDRFSTKKGGLVYGVFVNLTQKSVTVVFRGTVGLSDVFTDKDFTLDHKSFFESEDHISVPDGKPATHNGFTSYLMASRQTDSCSRTYVERVLACVNAEFGENPDVAGKDFKLFVTGHSLGGGLANLFSFRVAQLKSMDHESVKNLPKMVKGVTFASPCVGNGDYNKEFEALERKGFLRHIRVANDGDVVPTNCIGWPYRMAISGDTSEYLQNGVNLQFYNDKKVEIAHGKTSGFKSQWGITTSLGNHGLGEYRKRVHLPVNKDAYNHTIEAIYKEATNDFASSV